ncbi:MAG TPA: hypothetical protein VGB64_04050 [Actinomycetota bacterium]
MAKGEGFDKLSVSIPKRLAREVRRHAGDRGLSAFAARAMRHEIERDQLGMFLADLEDKIGPVDEREVSEIDSLWPDS